METTAKWTCVALAQLLKAYGVRHAVVSPGTRNAPVIVALARTQGIDLHYVVDERTAAFVALGIALHSATPVPLVCTSGTAMLNYAPAIAEAFYRRVPLIVVSADRPYSLIDQRDSQTIRQPGALANFVRCCVDIMPEQGTGADRIYVNRLFNEALQKATGHIPGPVHINLQLDAPLGHMAEYEAGLSDCYPIKHLVPRNDAASVCELVKQAGINANKKILVICGGATHECPPDVSGLPSNVALLAEAQANVVGAIPLGLVDRDLDHVETPDIVVTLGGSLVSARTKAWLRRAEGTAHVSIGADDCIVDTFGKLACIIDVAENEFFEALKNVCRDSALRYADVFADASQHGVHCIDTECSRPGSPVRVMRDISLAVSGLCSAVHVSNGSAIRYAQLFNWNVPFESNRGVSGIDGCTSTAVGASLVSDGPVLIVTGDVSAAYDLGALAVGEIDSRFRMIVFDNRGGDIFRNISATRALRERESYLAALPRFPLKAVAEDAGMRYIAMTAAEVDVKAVKDLLVGDKPAVMHVCFNPEDTKDLL